MRLLALLLFLATPAFAWDTPQRGSQLRADLMSAIRPHAEWILGAPVEFVIHDLRVSGDVAFAAMHAQRPGGIEIDLNTVPGALRGEYDPAFSDGSSIQALLQKSGNVWVATHHAIGATDVWWFWDAFCPVWHPVIPEACAG
ncbi:hypothetical protein [Pacificoceanicola onchidii]|uniref:hypothetical protein n=1 Tax=Pacificoceanicola onchidii TaxID=2562685 RepID=UPI0010A2D427|nr:hypothetical protein [Pacificoceanicola onchidii]